MKGAFRPVVEAWRGNAKDPTRLTGRGFPPYDASGSPARGIPVPVRVTELARTAPI
ncbi:hypothetical protein Sxan_66410 [Streptomyces xanthophaeus]|uniref:Uncharacterized protein n=1 Tax=Streptomyces xanthophaeus TaxID=67385 RepID=A0A919H2I8_9ACTN|nr:hypothetical protein Sxan_66410 [Streptomyces xanthophaeus]